MPEPAASSPEDQMLVSSLYTEENANAAISWVIENLAEMASKPMTSTVVVAYILGHTSLRFTSYAQGPPDQNLMTLYNSLCDCDDCQDCFHACGETSESAVAAGFDFNKLIKLMLFLLELYAKKQ